MKALLSLDRGAAVAERLAAGFLLLLMVVVMVDVVGRSVLNQPLPWGTEVLEVLLAASIFLLYPILALQGGHVTVDLIHMPRMATAQRVLTGLIGGALFAVIAWALCRQALLAADYGEAMPMLRLPYGYVFGVMAALALITSLLFLVTCVRRTQTAHSALDALT